MLCGSFTFCATSFSQAGGSHTTASIEGWWVTGRSHLSRCTPATCVLGSLPLGGVLLGCVAPH
jgi:hypothetical protein